MIHVLQTRTANTASVLAALRRAGAEPVLVQGAEEIPRASHLILPGVGAFAAALEALDGMEQALRERIDAGRPTLGICLGFQLLGQGSEESPGAEGFGLLPGVATRYPAGVRVPQLGWNRVEPDADCRLLEPGYAYFANSYRFTERFPGWGTATADHGGPFVAAVERGPVLACQFHPELSGSWGLALLGRWLETSC